MRKRAWEKNVEKGGDQPPGCCVTSDRKLICSECEKPIRGRKKSGQWLCSKCNER